MKVKYHSAQDIEHLKKTTAGILDSRDRLIVDSQRSLTAAAGESPAPDPFGDRRPNIFSIECHIRDLGELADELALYDLEATQAIEQDALTLAIFASQLGALERRETAARHGNADGLMHSRQDIVNSLAESARRGPGLWRRKSHTSQHPGAVGTPQAAIAQRT